MGLQPTRGNEKIVVPAKAGTHCRANGFPLARE